MNSKVYIPSGLWKNLVRALKERGNGERESGAFLLGKENSNRVETFICYDDLDEEALQTGIITLHAKGFMKLWEKCQEEGLRVLADIHTHPSSWVDQSEADRTHPMVAQKGHIGLILPNYAGRVEGNLTGVGIYEYLGDHNWKAHSQKNSPVQITLL
jgi:proteasome lid subunit RPN8/RPN11